MNTKLHSREYKLLLDPRQFRREFTQEDANDFLYKLKDRLTSFRGIIPDEIAEFETRPVQFWDMPSCALTANDFALRSRGERDDVEVTLKLRKPDYFMVKAFYEASGPYREDGFEGKFEEDIAPLEVKPKGADQSIVFPIERSIRSRYSCSITVKQNMDARTTIKQIYAWFPMLKHSLNIKVESSKRPLVSGDNITESVARSEKIAFSDDVDGRLSLTVWRFAKNDVASQVTAPEIAEISFKCKTIEGDMPAAPAQKAYDFFIALQSHLNVNMSDASKTSLALPSRCACY